MDGQTRTARRRARLVRTLQSAGVLPDPAWRDAFAEVPRHLFLTRFFRAAADGRWLAVDRADPDWLDQVYADQVLITQLDDDPARWTVARESGPVFGVPTSSSSQPAIMAVMLTVLTAAPGHRVLEIGTGTGYNAALLCHRLGHGRVTTVDIDAGLVATARERLADCGYTPTCVAGDGAEGHPGGAPYDRVLATCSVATIPLPWLAQTVPGGVVVTTLHRPLGAGLVRITVGDGATGEGRVLAEDGRFMPLRAHRVVTASRPDAADSDVRPTALGADVLTSYRSRFEFYAGLALPEATATADQDGTVWLAHPDGSWVRHGTSKHRHQVWQGGPRRLWDTVEAAYDEWQALGRPARDRFGITVRPDRQELWLDNPAGPHHWPLTTAIG
ncbi:MAG TPA: ATP-grasp peptide maturase system methyltransferase [Pseudonocardiaceae bacterium]|jgi:methyltransferase of ATP-grasp peptide maturase system|nr:ATP-grasp peptide maturase system methyltransferase [Pseudonocardiaceae bacterium]